MRGCEVQGSWLSVNDLGDNLGSDPCVNILEVVAASRLCKYEKAGSHIKWPRMRAVVGICYRAYLSLVPEESAI